MREVGNNATGISLPRSAVAARRPCSGLNSIRAGDRG